MAEFHQSTEGNVSILAISGRLDPNSWREMNEAMTKLVDGGAKQVVVDLENVDYMASAGFRELFLLGKKLGREGGKMAVCSLRGEVKRVFELAGFATAYPIFPSRAEAVAGLSG